MSILQGNVERKMKRSSPRNNWMYKINKWTKKNISELNITRMAEDREEWDLLLLTHNRWSLCDSRVTGVKVK